MKSARFEASFEAPSDDDWKRKLSHRLVERRSRSLAKRWGEAEIPHPPPSYARLGSREEEWSPLPQGSQWPEVLSWIKNNLRAMSVFAVDSKGLLVDA
ncbi:MAG: hypothetical protein RMJ84_12630, partial [Sandaracinaceae bacterium]|nr:hypothetical protein [Sandaracinaceae bacterium]